jgi:hypothetical protein
MTGDPDFRGKPNDPAWCKKVKAVSREVARLQSVEGAIIGISYAPALHD